MNASHRWLAFLALVLVAAPASAVEPISLHPDNPHYFLWRGKPTILITSGEHYGAVLNLDFDYAKYLETLARDRLNLTRVWTGGPYLEPQGAFNIARNTLAPADGRLISPYARSQEPGFKGGGNKFDLSRWDEAYFRRLHDFMRQASRRGVVVELNLFCPMYEEKQWQLSPYHPSNNVNRLGPVDRLGVYTLDRHGGLLLAQEILTRKLVEELKGYDHLYFEVMNEPYATAVPMNWQEHIADLIVETEKQLGVRHLISLNIANNAAEVKNPHPAVSIFNFHYAAPPDTVPMNYHLNKVIGDNETGFRGTNDSNYRMEGWDFVMAGGGLYNHLDYSFTAGHEDGTFIYPATQPGGGSPALRSQLRKLREFMEQLDFIRLKPDPGVLQGGVPGHLTARALSRPGKTYAFYFRPAIVTRFSVRWEGRLEAAEAGDYLLHTLSNDGVRLWLDGRPLIDNWTDHDQVEDSARVTLEAGRAYDLKLEYFYNRGQAVMRLGWTPPGGRKEPLPANRLRQSDGSPGLKAAYFRGTRLRDPWQTRTDAQVNFNWGTASPFAPAASNNTGPLTLGLPAGHYRAEWISPVTGMVEKRESFEHAGGTRSLDWPPIAEDMALLIRAR